MQAHENVTTHELMMDMKNEMEIKLGGRTKEDKAVN